MPETRADSEGLRFADRHTEEKLFIGLATWIVRITGDVCQIIDDQGRERHRSIGHMKTALFLANQIASQPFVSVPNLDAALRKRAEPIRSSTVDSVSQSLADGHLET
jgi:hypothetical protein